MRYVIGGLLIVWFILKVILHKGGYVHLPLIAAITLIGISVLATRNARYHHKSSGPSDEV